MKKYIALVPILLVMSGCVSVNTIESVKNEGEKSDVFYSDLPQKTLEDNVTAYINKCYKTSLVKMNGTTLGEVIRTKVSAVSDGKEFAAMQVLGTKGYNYILIVSVKNKAAKKTKLTAYSSGGRGARSFEHIEDIAKGETPSCPFVLI
jgi:hypothetical protein